MSHRDDTITVIIATYNRPQLVMRAIASAVDQCDAIIVVDDRSTMQYNEDLIRTSGPNVNFIRMPQNGGPQLARNTGLDAAETDWAFILDDDDEFEPGVLRAAIKKIRALDGHEKFRVFNFATSNGSIPAPFMIVDHGDYLTRRLVGDFTPAFNLRHTQRPSYVLPEVRGAGTDHLMWWQVASEEGIPTWRDEKLLRVTNDAGDRMTSPKTFIKNAEAFASMQSMTLTQIQLNGWHLQYPAAEKLRMRALLLYSLVSGNQGWVKHAVQQFSGPEKHAARLAAIVPSFVYRHGFYWARRWKQRKSH